MFERPTCVLARRHEKIVQHKWDMRAITYEEVLGSDETQVITHPEIPSKQLDKLHMKRQQTSEAKKKMKKKPLPTCLQPPWYMKKKPLPTCLQPPWKASRSSSLCEPLISLILLRTDFLP